jgi:hypothetical protein
MNMRLAALVLLTCAPMLAWERRVALRGTDWIDTPTLHSLEFFKTNRCVDHAPMERRLDQSCKPDRIDLKQVGIVGKWVIYDLTYYDSTGEVDAESVLVQTGPQQVREILYRDCEEGRGSTTKTAVLHISGTTMAYSRYDRAEEYGVWSAEYFFSFRSRGDKVMRLEPLVRAGQKQLPDELAVFVPKSEVDFHDFTWTAGVYYANPQMPVRYPCCVGSVTVRLKIARGQFVPISAEYDADK